MYEIRKNSKVIALVETPTFVYRLDNGDFGLTNAEHATGVAVNGEILDIGEVTLNRVDGGAILADQTAVQNDLDALTVDHELRIMDLELGISEGEEV